MSDNRKYYYLKLKENYFDEDAIVLLESMQDGTQFVSTQDRQPRLGLKAVETSSTSCESCQALSALFPIAGARAANTA